MEPWIDAREIIGGASAKFDGATDDTAALQNVIALTAEEFGDGCDVGGGKGGWLQCPKGKSVLSAPFVVPGHVKIKGGGDHATVLYFASLPANQDAIRFGDGSRAEFGGGLEDIQVFIGSMPRAGNSSAVRTSDLQHTGGFRRVKIFAQGSIGLWLDGGTGGASYIAVHDVEVFNHPYQSGNPGMIVDYDGSSIVDMQRCVIQAPVTPHAANVPGILHAGSILNAGSIHFEGFDFGIQVRNQGRNPRLNADCITGNPQLYAVIVIDAAMQSGRVSLRQIIPCGAGRALWNLANGQQHAEVLSYAY